jgi:transposase InsO family protein
MTALYLAAGTSKQAHLAFVKRQMEREDKFLMLRLLLEEERAKHPAMSLKKLYLRIAPDFVGRDLFIEYCMENGFEATLPYKKCHTTHSSQAGAYSNLCVDLVLIDMNQLWVSDITYFKIGDVFFYIVLIMDVYSRKILGYHASDRMFAEANRQALLMALKTRGIKNYGKKLIHHSDKGSQYRSILYVEALLNYGIRISMGNCCFDNAHMESHNGIIKNEYLIHRPIHSGNDLIKFLRQDVRLYNDERPHGSLGMMTPSEFERYICNIPLEERTRLPIFADKFKANKKLILPTDTQQLEINFPGFIL